MANVDIKSEKNLVATTLNALPGLRVWTVQFRKDHYTVNVKHNIPQPRVANPYYNLTNEHQTRLEEIMETLNLSYPVKIIGGGDDPIPHGLVPMPLPSPAPMPLPSPVRPHKPVAFYDVCDVFAQRIVEQLQQHNQPVKLHDYVIEWLGLEIYETRQPIVQDLVLSSGRSCPDMDIFEALHEIMGEPVFERVQKLLSPVVRPRIRCKRPLVAKPRRMEQSIFRTIVEMAYEMASCEWKDTVKQLLVPLIRSVKAYADTHPRMNGNRFPPLRRQEGWIRQPESSEKLDSNTVAKHEYVSLTPSGGRVYLDVTFCRYPSFNHRQREMISYYFLIKVYRRHMGPDVSYTTDIYHDSCHINDAERELCHLPNKHLTLLH